MAKKKKKSSERFDSKGREKLRCGKCGGWYHRLDRHIAKAHGLSTDEYLIDFPGEKLKSEAAEEAIKRSRKGSYDKEKKKTEVIPIEDETKLDFGVASLRLRTDLEDFEKEYVPEHDENWVIGKKEMELMEDFAVGIEDAENIYIHGPTGCGKSALALEIAACINQPALRVQMKRDFKGSDFVGKLELSVNKEGKQITRFIDGVLPFCMTNGFWLILDEYDQAHPDVHMACQAVLEGQDLILTEDYGRIVKKDPFCDDKSKNFRIIATGNTFGRGDDTGLYSGSKIQNEATLDRFATMMKMTYPETDTEVEILKKKSNLKEDDIKKMVSVAQKVRKGQEEENCSCTFSTRRLIAWARKTDRYIGDIRRAARVAVLNRLDGDDSRFVDNLIQRYFGGVIS